MPERGATTLELLALFPAERTEYWFTDISPGFTSLAKQKFQNYPFLRCQVLDIEKEPARQGFEPKSYDLVIAANVLHATADVRQALAHARALLASGGLLILRESTSPLRYVDLIFGLTEGWWRFTDRSLRPSHPLLSVAKWRDLLEAEGFTEVAGSPQPLSREGKPISTETILIAARRFASSREHRGTGSSLLTATESPCVWPRFFEAEAMPAYSFRRANFETVNAQAFTVNPDRADDFHRLFPQIGPVNSHHILYLWSLDCQDDSDPATEAEVACHACLNLVQSLLSVGFAAMPTLTLITRAAMPADSRPNCGFSQAGIWGIGGILALEHPEYDCVVIDLDRNIAERSRGNPGGMHSAETHRATDCIRAGSRWCQDWPASLHRRASKPTFDPDAVSHHRRSRRTRSLRSGLDGCAQGKHLVLAGRSAPDAFAQAQSSRAVRRQPLARADVSQRERRSPSRRHRLSGHPLRGILLAAGCLMTACYANFRWERFSSGVEA